MIHLHAVRELVHHDHLHGAEGQPVAGEGRAQDELDDFAGVEVAADEFGVGGMFLERHEGQVVRFHDRVADGCDAFEEVLRVGVRGAWERFDEDDARVRRLVAGVEALDA